MIDTLKKTLDTLMWIEGVLVGSMEGTRKDKRGETAEFERGLLHG